jgi:putative FmdB family regulatory protein
MPTYEYKCRKCEEIFEFFQKMTDKPVEKCPVCSGKLSKLISGGVGVIFKGSGFYTTDYKNASQKSEVSKKKEGEKKEPADKTQPSSKKETASKN